jgi:hypothetical protein
MEIMHVFYAMDKQVNQFSINSLAQYLNSFSFFFFFQISSSLQFFLGSGKTYSFLGPEGHLEQETKHQDELQQYKENQSTESCQAIQFPSSTMKTELLPKTGILLRTVEDLFQAKQAMSHHQLEVMIKLQVIEVYEEKVTDLIAGRTVQVRRDTGQIVHGSEHLIHNIQHFLQLYELAHARQRFAETAMNARSSRAHTIVIFQVQQQRRMNIGGVVAVAASSTAASTTEEDQPAVVGNEDQLLVTSQLYLVDLAGSERVKKSGVTGDRMREAVGINSSLLVLGKVISALVEAKSHVPYFESKLTTLLKAAFGGNARTSVLVHARSESEHADETLQSLRFGERCSMISNELKQMASSYELTMQTMNQTLQQMEQQLQQLIHKKKNHLESFQTLKLSYDNLLRKKQELLLLNEQKGAKSIVV